MQIALRRRSFALPYERRALQKPRPPVIPRPMWRNSRFPGLRRGGDHPILAGVGGWLGLVMRGTSRRKLMGAFMRIERGGSW